MTEGQCELQASQGGRGSAVHDGEDGSLAPSDGFAFAKSAAGGTGRYGGYGDRVIFYADALPVGFVQEDFLLAAGQMGGAQAETDVKSNP